MATENGRTQRDIRTTLREHFLNNVGQIVDAAEIQAVSGGIADLARHLRELRDDEGLVILTHAERSGLLPGQYLLESATPVPAFAPAISTEMRAYVMECNDLTCQMCGAEAGDVDEYDPARRLRLYVDHTTGMSEGGTDEPCNLRVLCSVCHEGVSSRPLDRSSSLEVLALLRRATGSAQLEALAWLVKKFPTRARFYLGGGDSR